MSEEDGKHIELSLRRDQASILAQVLGFDENKLVCRRN